MKYKWNCTVFSANADKVGKELEKIEKDEKLTSSNVVQYAQTNKKSELYKCFEWNNEVAGEKFRLFQANQILQSISIIINESENEVTKAFVNIKTVEEEKVFKNIVDVLSNDDEYNQLKQKAERDFVSYKKKYEQTLKLKDLKEIIFNNI